MDIADLKKIAEATLRQFIETHASQFKHELMIDQSGNRYLVIVSGWRQYQYIHHVVIHIDIIGDKLWIQCDRTEDAIAYDLLAAGIPNNKIVLGYKSERMRAHSEFAIS
ncbi:MAG: element excision factor XisI family protein [Anaerolineae bacterium]|nr:element excision factor XisI family protein [Anaerolineae bacterium]